MPNAFNGHGRLYFTTVNYECKSVCNFGPRSPDCLKLLVENVRNKDDLNELNEFGKFRHTVTKWRVTMSCDQSVN